MVISKSLVERKMKNLEGDCIIAAAIVIFLAPFDQKIRDYLKNKWLKMVENNGV